MKKNILLLLVAFCLASANAQSTPSNFITDDIDNFWVAYDKVVSTTDTTAQLNYLQTLYFDKGSDGLRLMMEARHYTSREYREAINNYPLFWASVRENTYKAKAFAKEIEAGAKKLKVLYPKLKDNHIYFTIGALRSPGTGKDGQVLVGSELAMTDENTNATEFVTSFQYLKTFFQGNPIKNIVFLNIHEYIHTQQKTEWGYDLLSQSLFEGIAEFIPTLVLEKASPTPAIAYGKANNQAVRAAFEKEMFSPWFDNWIWNDLNNPFKTRDLGYYIGYAIAEKYYNAASDKKQAIATLIELDFNDSNAIEAFVNRIGYFSKPINYLKKAYEKKRPKVIGIKQFRNNSQAVPASTTQITVEFSTPLDTRYASTGLGPLGRDYFPEVISRALTEDGRTMTYEVKLKPNQLYQLVVESGFRTTDATPLVPYLIEFKTAKE